MHFCYGIGALISPLIAQGFLLNEDCSAMASGLQGNVTDLEQATESTKVYQAFWIMAATQVAKIFLSAEFIHKCLYEIK